MGKFGKSASAHQSTFIGRVHRWVSIVSGTLLTINFLCFWAIPIGGMGMTWKAGLKPLLLPLYNVMDHNSWMRKFAEDYVYVRKEHADYFAISNCIFTIGGVFKYQLTHGSLPPWVIAAYYCSWVGVGGRVMGAAYTLAHREGHMFSGIYKKPLQNIMGNVFENGLGCFFGNVPYNFTTSHVFIHHRLDGGLGDSFYEWDLDRTSVVDFMVYQQRIFLHMVGYSSMKFFRANGQAQWADLLQRGVITYCAVGGATYLVTGSLAFVFWIYIQPLFCMTYFLALINIGFHGFIEYDEAGEPIPEVNSTTIIEGDDDYFGEDDHMAHHYASQVFHRDLLEHQKAMRETYKKTRASVFRGLSIAELSIFLIFGLYDELAKHYVDYTGTMTIDEIKAMLKTRAQRIEMPNEEYNKYLTNPTPEARKALRVNDIKSLQGQPYLNANAASASTTKRIPSKKRD